MPEKRTLIELVTIEEEDGKVGYEGRIIHREGVVSVGPPVILEAHDKGMLRKRIYENAPKGSDTYEVGKIYDKGGLVYAAIHYFRKL